MANPSTDQTSAKWMALRFTESGIIDADVIALSEMERDALSELANMGVSRATAGLRQMLGEQILLFVPSVGIIPRETAAQFLEESNAPKLIAVQQSFEGSFSGRGS
jgi:chemotaxis protein CheC